MSLKRLIMEGLNSATSNVTTAIPDSKESVGFFAISPLKWLYDEKLFSEVSFYLHNSLQNIATSLGRTRRYVHGILPRLEGDNYWQERLSSI